PFDLDELDPIDLSVTRVVYGHGLDDKFYLWGPAEDGDRGPDGDGPYRDHRDDERAEGVAVGVRHLVEGHEDGHRAVREEKEGDGHHRDIRPFHIGRILNVMNLLFGYHMPNYTYRGAPDAELFDRVVEQAQA